MENPRRKAARPHRKETDPMPDLLIELLSEEIPARMQDKAAEDLRRLVTTGLAGAGLTYGDARAFSTPRRLALSVTGLPPASPAVRTERRGPRVGAPDAAIEGFLRGAGITRDRLEEREDKKGRVFFAVIEAPGRPAAEIVAGVLEAAIRAFPWPKSMRWGAGRLHWIRPLQSILCILTDKAGAEVVPLDIDGLRAGNQTRGHRFMDPAPFAVTGFGDYAEGLRARRVILDAQERAEHIRQAAAELARAGGLVVVEDEGLLAEVAGLVEWPVVLMGGIDAAFLDLPPEVLRTSMRTHQKFFSVRNPETGRIEGFITVANTETPDNGATILAGNQRVLAARLADARFFWENDIQVAEAGGVPWLKALETVTFHNRLGTQAKRIGRIAALAREIAPFAGAERDIAARAALWAKADLSSEMVREFPELQGVMGACYAGPAGYPPEVADAAREHYSPVGPLDDTPTAPVSVTVALADKLDTLTGFWAIGDTPTGSKDPFALRRAALGVIRLVLENGLRMKLLDLCWSHADNHEPEMRGLMVLMLGARESQLMSFLHDRLKVHLRAKGVRRDVIDACIAMPGNDDLTLLVRRAQALATFLKTDDGENLLRGFRRANNILTQAEARDGVAYSGSEDVKCAGEEAETALFAALDRAEGAISPAIEAEDFAAAMGAMAALRAPVDAFFEAVQVNTGDSAIRRNRLNMLARMRALCLTVADLTRIEGRGDG